MMIEEELEDLRRKNSPRDIFIHYVHYFKLNLEKISFLCNDKELKILAATINPTMTKTAVIRGFQLQSSGLGVQRA